MQKLAQWHNAIVGRIGVIAIVLAFGYWCSLVALDSGNLWWYALLLGLILIAIHEAGGVIWKLIRHGKTTRA